MSEPLHPDVVVPLDDQDRRSSFRMMAHVSSALRRAGVPSEDRQRFQAQAVSSDPEQTLATVREWVTVE